jgi:hypothetical protein
MNELCGFSLVSFVAEKELWLERVQKQVRRVPY